MEELVKRLELCGIVCKSGNKTGRFEVKSHYGTPVFVDTVIDEYGTEFQLWDTSDDDIFNGDTDETAEFIATHVVMSVH